MFLMSFGVLWVMLNFFLKGSGMLYIVIIFFGMVIILFCFLMFLGKYDMFKMLMLIVVMLLFKSFFIIVVLIFLMLSYFLVGVILFGIVKYGEVLNCYVNFKISFDVMLFLFCIIIGEDWNKIMYDCMIFKFYCIENVYMFNFW